MAHIPVGSCTIRTSKPLKAVAIRNKYRQDGVCVCDSIIESNDAVLIYEVRSCGWSYSCRARLLR